MVSLELNASMTGAGAGLVVRPLLGPGRPVEGRGEAGVSVR